MTGLVVLEAPDPIDFLQHVMEARGTTRKDLEPYIGSRARVAEVLNRVRPLTLEMIRRLASGLDLPADVLIRRYELKRAAQTSSSRTGPLRAYLPRTPSSDRAPWRRSRSRPWK